MMTATRGPRHTVGASTRLAVRVAWLVAALATPGGTLAQEASRPPGGPMTLTLAEAIARGLDASPRLAELAARREASDAAVRVAHAAAVPQLAVQAGYTRTNHVDPFATIIPGSGLVTIYADVPDNWRSRLDLQWPVYTGGRVEALTAAARADAVAASRDVGAGRTDLRLEIARAYWNLVTARDAVAVVDASLRRVDAYLADTRARFDAGFVPPSDVLSAEAQRSLQQALLVESRNTAAVANLALARLIGVPPEPPIEPVEPLDRGAAPATDVAAQLEEARRGRQDRAALEERIAAAARRREAAASGRRPQLFVAAGVDYARPNPRIFPREAEWHESWDAGVAVSWNLFDGGRVGADVAATGALERALRQRLEDFDDALDVEVRQRRLDLESSQARAVATADAVRSAAEAHRVLQDRYAAGVATSTEVLDAQVRLLEAELARTRALAAVRMAAAGLERAVGRQ